MKRISQPFYRPKKGRWYVQLDGKQINLGADETGAWARYHEIMAERVRNPAPPKIIPIKTTIVASVLDAYLDWLKNRVQERSNAQRTYDWYLDYLQDFIRFQTDAYRMQDLPWLPFATLASPNLSSTACML